MLRLKHAKGLGYLARLLRHPNQEIHVMDLVAGGLSSAVDTGPRDYEQNLAVDHGSGAGPALDATARARYQLQVQELREEISTAERCNDPGRTAAARAELEFIAEELTRSVGLGAGTAKRRRTPNALALR